MGWQVIDKEKILSYKGQYDLDRWPLDPKINRGHILTKTSAPTKVKAKHPMACQVIDQKLFLPTRTVLTFKVNVTFDPLTLISIGIIYWLRPVHLCILTH
jgi:hypothetical protein